MNILNLSKVEHGLKVGMVCEDHEANITEDTLFVVDGKVIGFYLRKMPKEMQDIAEYCNRELMSDRVPKSMMNRGIDKSPNAVSQFSAILGLVQRSAFKRRYKNTISQLHKVKTAKDYIQGMALLAKKSEELIKQIMPEQYELQKKIIAEKVPAGYAFSELFTSSIANFGIACKYHIDHANLKDCVNVIIYKKKDADGGITHVPDFNAYPYCDDGGILVYPAWYSLHGVTPIKVHKK